MTVVGKILVFLNLVFSLVVGGFAVVDYAARTNWSQAYKKVNEDNAVLKQAMEAYRDQAGELAKEKAQLYESLQRVNWDPASKDDKDAGARIGNRAVIALQQRNKAIDDLKAKVDAMQRDLAAAKSTNDNLLSMEKVFRADAERRQKDTEILRDQLKVEMDKVLDKEGKMNLLRDDMTQAQIAARTLKDRNSQLEDQLQNLARTLAQARSTGGNGSQRGDNPPPEQVEGLVRKIDGRNVMISLGSDAGLSKGQTLHVFRLGSGFGYLGRIKVVEVGAKEAVGEVMGRLSKPIQVGDRVASRITGG